MFFPQIGETLFFIPHDGDLGAELVNLQNDYIIHLIVGN